MLEDSGLFEPHTDEDGRPALRLTDRGAQVGRALAMGGEDGGEVMEALLGDDGDTSR